MAGWKDKYRVVGVVPGKVITHKHGCIDLSGDLSEELCEKLVKEGFPYLEAIPAKATAKAASAEKNAE